MLFIKMLAECVGLFRWTAHDGHLRHNKSWSAFTHLSVIYTAYLC